MVGGAVIHPAATTEPDMKPFDRVSAGSTYQLRASFSLHPALPNLRILHQAPVGKQPLFVYGENYVSQNDETRSAR
jgi:hypothetical protein